MILIVEIPHAGTPRCWFAFDEDDFIRKLQATRQPGGAVVYQQGSARELLAAAGMPAVPTAETDAALLPPEAECILGLARASGWDATLYRADYLLAPGLYQREPVTEFVAWAAALAHGLRACRIYPDEALALEALHQEPLFAGRAGFLAHMALREQLIALEVLADDF